MTVTNIVVALMAVTTNVTPVRVYTPALDVIPYVVNGETNYFRDAGRYETLYRMTATTNFTFVSRMEHRLAKPGADIGAVARSTCWVRFCDCPCHGGSVVEHDSAWGRGVPDLKPLTECELLSLQDAVKAEMARRSDDTPLPKDLVDAHTREYVDHFLRRVYKPRPDGFSETWALAPSYTNSCGELVREFDTAEELDSAVEQLPLGASYCIDKHERPFKLIWRLPK